MAGAGRVEKKKRIPNSDLNADNDRIGNQRRRDNDEENILGQRGQVEYVFGALVEHVGIGRRRYRHISQVDLRLRHDDASGEKEFH